MKKDIHIPKVTNVAIAIVNEKEDWFACMPDEMFHALEEHLGWHLCITCVCPTKICVHD